MPSLGSYAFSNSPFCFAPKRFSQAKARTIDLRQEVCLYLIKQETSNYKMGVEKENRLHSVLKQMDFRKEYLRKLRIWNLTPIKLYVPTYPWGAFMH